MVMNPFIFLLIQAKAFFLYLIGKFIILISNDCIIGKGSLIVEKDSVQLCNQGVLIAIFTNWKNLVWGLD